MEAALLQCNALDAVIHAIRTCYDSGEAGDSYFKDDTYVLGTKDTSLLHRIIESGHESTIEHCNFTFMIEGISRGCLQELVRHRIGSFSVKSTRYTLGRIKEEESFRYSSPLRHDYDWDRVKKYLVMSVDAHVNDAAANCLEGLRILAVQGVPNDQLKYALPESFKTSLVWTINARALRNFLKLRLDRKAHWEIRELAGKILKLVSVGHYHLFYDLLMYH